MSTTRRHETPEVQTPHTDDRWLRCREVANMRAISERQVWRLARSDGAFLALLEPARLRMPGRVRSLTRWRLSDVRRLLDDTP